MQNGMMKWLSKLLRFKDNQKGNNIVMKLASLEKIKNYIQTQINPYGEPFKGTAYEFGIKLLDYLNNKDADYDVEKVVEELKNEKEFWNDATYNKEIGKQKARSYAYAIEIVQSNGFLKTTLKNNNGWIPCSERLPETLESEAKAYLTTNENGMIGVSYYHPMCGWSNGYESVFDVIAWQPLPEPYREEQEDE